MAGRTDEDLELGESDDQELHTFPPPERKVVTQPYDLSVATLLEQWEGQLLILPEIQREYVWDDGRASRLVESLLLNIPIPVLYLSETEDARYEIIDGHQRIRSIVRFLQNEFRLQSLRVLSEYNRLRYFELPEKEQRFLKLRTLRAIVISAESHPSMKFEIFERLNTGSISLNAQELRNSLFRGTFNRLLRDSAKHPLLREMIGTKQPRKRMVDEELILRFFALEEGLKEYRPPLKRFLNEYMNAEKNPSPVQLEEMSQKLTVALAQVYEYLSTSAFRLIDRRGRILEPSINRSLFDSQMMAFYWVSGGNASQKQVISALGSLYTSDDFLDVIRSATGDRSRTLQRIRQTVEALSASGLSVEVPFVLAE